MSTPTAVAHWRDLPLQAGGRALVEASAGTGKTWTIGVLYLRLLLESAPALAVGQVVVTTFTDAAAQELRQRLRQRLREALQAQQDATLMPGEDGDWLRQRWADPARCAEDRRRLRLALADFDRAPVGTLHGLCQRILAEHPFESGSRFDPGTPTSGQALDEEIARDAWRVLHQGGAADDGRPEPLNLAGFTRTLRQLLAPGVQIDASAPDLPTLAAGWPPGIAASLREVVDDAGWFARSNARLRSALAALADRLDGIGPWPSKDQMDVLDGPVLDKQVRPARQADFLALPVVGWLRASWPALSEARHVPTLRFWQAQVAQARRWRDERLAARGQVTFDEMIRRAHDAILANPALADALFADWPVALVDEFQDTDAQQYRILDRLYREADGRPRGRLVMIGDPKQAIYGFRGGDIHAYRRARADASHQLRLDTNHRSSRAYVAAVNQFYAAGGETLGQAAAEDVRYRPVQASDRRDGAPYTVAGRAQDAPLQVHYLPDPPDGQDARRRLALAACANQIAGLLAAGTHAIGGHPLRPGDLAVLLPRNRDIASLRMMLQARGVPCVGAARDSVFAGDMAFELQLVLAALLAGGDEGVQRAALLTRLWGFDLPRLAALDATAPDWDALAARRLALRQRWQAEGVLSVVQALAAEAAPSLLAAPGGERDLTDLRHLGELLQQRAERGGGPRELLAWLSVQRQGEGDEDIADERELRLESDAANVRLLSLHKAKGLEFPIVFLPLMWAQDAPTLPSPCLVPLPGGGRRAALDEAARELARWDQQDERHRLLYVALTRAIHACHVYALPPDRRVRTHASPLADPKRAPLDAMVERLLGPGGPPRPNVDWRMGPWPEAFTTLPPSPAPAPREVPALPSPPAATPLRQRLSFSSLVGGLRAAPVEEAAADDERPAAIAPAPVEEDDAVDPAFDALSGVRGTAFGNALHVALELRAHDRPMTAQGELLLRQLREHGVRPREGRLEALVPALAERLEAALAAELLPGLRLATLPPARQRAEMAFHFALDGARLSRLRAACAAHGEPGLVPPLATETLRGLMTGKIDLVLEHEGVFHVLDYKGNWLGPRRADYEGEALRAAMDHSHYRLQALLYTVALHRFLRQRLPGYDPGVQLGAAIYLFVRAAGLAPGAGVYRERFDPALVAAVDAALASTEATA